jgi:hypothetical protein
LCLIVDLKSVNNSTSPTGYLRTVISFIAASLLAAIMSFAPLVIFGLLSRSSSGEGSYWAGLALTGVAVGMFVVLTVVLTYVLVALSLRRAGLAKSRETAVLCVAMLPLSLLLFTVPFIPLLARYLALRSNGVPKKAGIPLAIAMFIGGVAGYNWFNHQLAAASLTREYHNMDLEKDRILGSQYQLVRSVHSAGSPNTTYTFAASGTYASLTNSITATLQNNGYVLRPNGPYSSPVYCNKGPNTAMAWECSFSGLKAKYQATITVTLAGTAKAVPNSLIPDTRDEYSQATALEGGSPVKEFFLSLWSQTSEP